MESKKDDSGRIPKSSYGSLAAGYLFYKLSIKWGSVQIRSSVSFYEEWILRVGNRHLKV